jgi:asparagine synthase (glutamine-hydrolysing)
VPAPRTIFREVEKLAPGHRLEVSGANVAVRRYWDVADVARRGQQACDRRSEPDIVEELHALLADAVKRQMVSDVPLGAFLSGGIDSSAVVALMQRAASRPVKTFSIGFREQAFNEADHAKVVARHLGTDHTELVLSAADAQAIIPELPAIYDEPFADSSQIPTYLVSRLARQHVTVALSGDGGDEVFGGYVRYQGIARLAGAARRLPRPLRRLAARSIELISADAWDMLARPLPQRFKPRHAGDKIRKGAALLGEDDALDMYRRVVSHTPRPGCFLPGVSEPADVIERLRGETAGLDTVSRLRLLDMMTYLPDDVLTKVDRASMAVGLEARVPLLDHRVVEFAGRCSRAMCPNLWSTGPRWASAFRSGSGSRGRCGHGRRICCLPPRSRTGCSITPRCAGGSPNSCRDGAMRNTVYGPCCNSRRGGALIRDCASPFRILLRTRARLRKNRLARGA